VDGEKGDTTDKDVDNTEKDADNTEKEPQIKDYRKRFRKAVRDNEVMKQFNLKEPNYRSPSVMNRRTVFDIRTQAMRTEGKKKQGRMYSTKYAKKVGGLRVDEMIYGMKMAHLSCTDDGEDHLKVPKPSPNCMAAMEHLVGGDDPATTCMLPLSQILKEVFGLNLDCWIDESGIRKGRPVDTQAFIASNDSTIVLSFRFTTSVMDWLANLTFHHSEWEPDEDLEQGHAGWCSQYWGWFTKVCNPKKAKPRVQTAYYNNFIYVIPMIQKHIIEPLLSNDSQTPKKVYVVGCSLGAAMSQIAYCYILEKLYHKLLQPEYKAVERLISVTAGCPRVGDRKFVDATMERIRTLRSAGLDRAVICRLVYNKDIVPHAPLNVMSFRHMDKLVYITKGGEYVLVNPDLSKIFSKFNEVKTLYKTIFQTKKERRDEKRTSFGERANEKLQSVQGKLNIEPRQSRKQSRAAAAAAEKAAADANKTAFEIECENALEGIHDHMPYWYMTHLEKLRDDMEPKDTTKKWSADVPAAVYDEDTSNDDSAKCERPWPTLKAAVRNGRRSVGFLQKGNKATK